MRYQFQNRTFFAAIIIIKYAFGEEEEQYNNITHKQNNYWEYVATAAFDGTNVNTDHQIADERNRKKTTHD